MAYGYKKYPKGERLSQGRHFLTDIRTSIIYLFKANAKNR